MNSKQLYFNIVYVSALVQFTGQKEIEFSLCDALCVGNLKLMALLVLSDDT